LFNGAIKHCIHSHRHEHQCTYTRQPLDTGEITETMVIAYREPHVTFFEVGFHAELEFLEAGELWVFGGV